MKKVLVIDSGSGGINVLAKCIKKGCSGNYLFYADTKNAPYGDKSNKELRKILCEIMSCVRPFFHFDIVLLACNTLTTSTIDYMRKKFNNIIFIGTVPAVKPAFEKYERKDVLLMATNRTLENLNEKGLCVPNLPSLIDENILSFENLRSYLFENLGEYRDKKAIVLGCTHYVAVKNIIQEIMPKAEIFDSAEGVAKRVKLFCGEGDYQVQFMVSKGENAIFSTYFQNLLQ